jgi:hypothetical protein
MNVELPYIKKSFLNKQECVALIKVIQRYSKNDPRFPARVSTEKRTEVPARLIATHGLADESMLLEQIRRRCQSEIEANFTLECPIYDASG